MPGAYHGVHENHDCALCPGAHLVNVLFELPRLLQLHDNVTASKQLSTVTDTTGVKSGKNIFYTYYTNIVQWVSMSIYSATTRQQAQNLHSGIYCGT